VTPAVLDPRDPHAGDAMMPLDRTSQTQLSTAIKRAAHQLLDSPRILEDPVALRVVPEAADPAVLARLTNGAAPDPVLLRSLFVMRSRFAEDRLAQAASRGVGQFVMIGAGLDTFPWRQPDFARSMRLFAADHPASLEFARAHVRQCRLTPHGESRPDLPQPSSCD
jgi:methyltransferase (TIGR00027 family)